MRRIRPTSVGRKVVDFLALGLSLGLVLGITVLGIQKHASHKQLAKKSSAYQSIAAALVA